MGGLYDAATLRALVVMRKSRVQICCSDGTNSDECLPTMVGCLELGQVVCTDMAIFLWCIMPQVAGIRRMLLTSRTGVHPRQAL